MQPAIANLFKLTTGVFRGTSIFECQADRTVLVSVKRVAPHTRLLTSIDDVIVDQSSRQLDGWDLAYLINSASVYACVCVCVRECVCVCVCV